MAFLDPRQVAKSRKGDTEALDYCWEKIYLACVGYKHFTSIASNVDIDLVVDRASDKVLIDLLSGCYDGQYKSYCREAMRNAASVERDRGNAKKRKPAHSLLMSIDGCISDGKGDIDVPDGGQLTPTQEAEKRELEELVRKAIAECLNQEEREALCLLFGLGWSLKKTGAGLDLSISKVINRRNRAIKKLGRYFDLLVE